MFPSFPSLIHSYIKFTLIFLYSYYIQLILQNTYSYNIFIYIHIRVHLMPTCCSQVNEAISFVYWTKGVGVGCSSIYWRRLQDSERYPRGPLYLTISAENEQESRSGPGDVWVVGCNMRPLHSIPINYIGLKLHVDAWHRFWGVLRMGLSVASEDEATSPWIGGKFKTASK